MLDKKFLVKFTSQKDENYESVFPTLDEAMDFRKEMLLEGYTVSDIEEIRL